MKEYFIGAGGWTYFRVPRLNPLVAYSRVFNFVEVGSTYYRIPSSMEAEKWRKLVPPSFMFAVTAHHSIVRKYKLQPVDGTFETFRRMVRICSTLRTEIMHLLLPSSFDTFTIADSLRNLLPSLNLGKLRLAVEIRRKESSPFPSELVKTMQDLNIIHCVDVSKSELPAFESDTFYTRLFGKGEHNVYQPTDGELSDMDNKISLARPQKILMSFHFVKMYKDAARFKLYKETGRFPAVTRSRGIASLKEVLSEDATFPSTRQELIRHQGWKIFDLNETKRVQTRDTLEKLPDRVYDNLGEVIKELKSIVR